MVVLATFFFQLECCRYRKGLPSFFVSHFLFSLIKYVFCYFYAPQNWVTARKHSFSLCFFLIFTHLPGITHKFLTLLRLPPSFPVLFMHPKFTLHSCLKF